MSEEEQDQAAEGLLPIDEHEEIVSEDGRKVRRRGIYLLPNMLTLGCFVFRLLCRDSWHVWRF